MLQKMFTSPSTTFITSEEIVPPPCRRVMTAGRYLCPCYRTLPTDPDADRTPELVMAVEVCPEIPPIPPNPFEVPQIPLPLIGFPAVLESALPFLYEYPLASSFLRSSQRTVGPATGSSAASPSRCGQTRSPPRYNARSLPSLLYRLPHPFPSFLLEDHYTPTPDPQPFGRSFFFNF